VNPYADVFGGAELLVSLDGDKLLLAAREAAGLSDVGDDTDREVANRQLINGPEEEAHLNNPLRSYGQIASYGVTDRIVDAIMQRV
jgi:hypothetical protein